MSEARGRSHGAILRIARRLAYQPALNRVVRGVATALYPVLSPRVLRRIPLVGTFRLETPLGQRFLLRSDGGDGILRRLVWSRKLGFERSLGALFCRLAARCRTFVDVGANTGLYAVMAGVVNPAARVVAFEPLPRAFEHLRKNIEINRLDNVVAERMALTDRDGTVELHVPPASRFIPTTSSLRQDFRSECEVELVDGCRLDSYVRIHGIRGIDLVKLDAEGAEASVLAGAAATLSRDRPVLVCEVLPGLSESSIDEILAPLDYRYFWISREGVREVKEIVGHANENDANYLFVPSEKVAALRDGGLV